MRKLFLASVLVAILLGAWVALAPQATATVNPAPPLRLLIVNNATQQVPLQNVQIIVQVFRHDAAITDPWSKYTISNGTCVIDDYLTDVMPGDQVRVTVNGPSGCTPYTIPFDAGDEGAEDYWVVDANGGTMGSCGVTMVEINGIAYYRACPSCGIEF